MKVRESLVEAVGRLRAASETPRLDAELLMAHALGSSREQLLLRLMDAPAPAGFAGLVERRLANEPVAYIIGRRDFWTISLEIGPGVLVPRPDSESLIAAALEHFGPSGPKRILDLGTGPGTLLLSALDQWPAATGLGIDRSEQALAFARRNAQRLGLSKRVAWRLGDWAEGLADAFDLILCNPPYIETEADLPPDVSDWEPAEALFAGADGLEAYRRLAPQLRRLIAPGGIACVEIGAGQEGAVADLLNRQELRVTSRSDLNGLVRCLIATLDRE